MALVPFRVWWRSPQNQPGFWRTNGNGVAISLGETPRSIFRQILQRLKEYHDRNVGYGNLLDGVRIGENNQVNLRNYGQPNPDAPLARRLACIRQDFLDFEELVTEVEGLIFVQPAYSSTKFHGLCRLLDNDVYYNGVDGLSRFGFYMRNNPLFLDEAAKFLFFRKVLAIKEFHNRFSTSVTLDEIQGWSGNVHHARLIAVKYFNYPVNHHRYLTPVGSIVFYRNCLGHVRQQNGGHFYHDARILHVLEDDLPKVIPVWFYELVRQLGSNIQLCQQLCGYSWMEFLSMQPTVFT